MHQTTCYRNLCLSIDQLNRTMKNFYILISLLLMGSILSAQNWSRISIDKDTPTEKIGSLGIPVENIIRDKVTGRLIMEISEHEIERLNNDGVNYEMEISDLESYYKKRLEKPADPSGISKEWEVPQGFEYGSMGGYLTLEEVMDHLDNMQAQYPDLISLRQPVSDMTTVGGRSLYWVRISDNPEVDEEESEVLYTALHHAREPAGLMHLIFYMYYILEHYDSDPEIQTLVDNTEMYFIPVVNPDGYKYNQTTNPSGGGMWRKNRFNNGDGTYGVDLNRNYGYMWGYDNSGSSPYTSDETYRGTSPFSENETQIVKEFCENHEFKMALNYHTYSNLLLSPWGFTEEPCEDNDRLMLFMEMMTAESGYTYGPGSTTIYPSNGGSDDWMYGEQETKNKIFAMTPEVGSGSDGFWPSQSRIIPLCQENMLQSLLNAQLAGDYVMLKETSSIIMENTEFYSTYNIQQIGLTPGENYTVALEPLCDEIISVGDANTYSAEQIEVLMNDSIQILLDAAVIPGTVIAYRFAIDNGSYTRYINVEKIYGQTTNLFFDECSTLENWSAQGWGISTMHYVSDPSSFSDSPNGNYGNNVNSELLLSDSYDLSNAIYGSVSFMAKWDIEADYDYVEFMASTDEGSTWIPLEGTHTVPGSSYQDEGMPLYEGQQSQWVTEEISLASVFGSSVWFKFRFYSDSYVNGEGFYFDDFSVDIISNSVGLNEEEFIGASVMPVPAKEKLVIRNPYNSEITNIQLFTTSGQLVNTRKPESTNGQQSIMNIEGLNAGLYLLSIQYKNRPAETIKVIIE